MTIENTTAEITTTEKPMNENTAVVLIGGYGSTELLGCNRTIRDVEDRDNLGAATLGKDIFYCGGMDSDYKYWSDCFVNINSSWVPVDSLKEARSLFTMNTVGQQMIVTGGENKTHTLDSIEIYLDGSWSLLENKLTSPRRGHCAVSISDTELLVIGGRSRRTTSKEVEIYSIDGSLVEKLPNLPEPRYYHACSVFNEEVWVSGGRPTPTVFKNDVFIFNLKSKSWRQGESLNYRRVSHTMNMFNNSVAVFGGEDKEDIVESMMEVYIPGKGWLVKHLEDHHLKHASVVIPCD